MFGRIGPGSQCWKDKIRIPMGIKIRPELESLKGYGHNSNNCSRRLRTTYSKMFIRIAPEVNVSKNEVKIQMCIKTGPEFQ